ncbi:hypothetical protein [Bradyrhizobium sp. JR3.5]
MKNQGVLIYRHDLLSFGLVAAWAKRAVSKRASLSRSAILLVCVNGESGFQDHLAGPLGAQAFYAAEVAANKACGDGAEVRAMDSQAAFGQAYNPGKPKGIGGLRDRALPVIMGRPPQENFPDR